MSFLYSKNRMMLNFTSFYMIIYSSIFIINCPTFTCSFSFTNIFLTLPVTVDTIFVSIFIASITAILSPLFTVSPSLISILLIFPGILAPI
uniref:Uncharacterized protein n=1 Tax=Clostridium sp. RKD TaxID=295236 RepID=Q5ZFP8_9CLOT|nr:hypothetical protein [Clostridium sp. RKD]